MQDESTGLFTVQELEGDDRVITPVPMPPLAELRADQLRFYGRWTAERQVV
jgi:hypothetical protein